MSEQFSARRTAIREDRGLVLDFLNAVFPADMAEAQLAEVMLDLPDPVTRENLERDLEYMRQRGLIAFDMPMHPVRKEKQKRWKLTAAGVTFLERDKPWAELEEGSGERQ